MTSSPRTLGSNFTNTAVNRGVEAKQIEIGNTRLDVGADAGAPLATAGGAGDGGGSCSPSTDPSSASFVQVVVQKQRRGARRLPAASSPNQNDGQGARDGRVPPTAVLLACPAFAALHRQHFDGTALLDAHQVRDGTASADTGDRRPGAGGGRAGAGAARQPGKKASNNIWKKISNIASGNEYYCLEDGPERLEVFAFERGCEALWARGRRSTRVQRLARAAARPAAAALRELLAVLRLCAALPVAVLIDVERCVLSTARALVCGAAQAAADEALKPALAASYNALLRPPLVLGAALLGALRLALRPLSLALGDAAEPLARLLASVRLVHVHTHCRCSHDV